MKDAITTIVAVLAFLVSLFNLKQTLAADRRASLAEERVLTADREKLELAFLSEQQRAMLQIDQAMDYLISTRQKWERLDFDARLVGVQMVMDTASDAIAGLEKQRGILADLRQAIDTHGPPGHQDIAILRRLITNLNPLLPAEAEKDQDNFTYEQARRHLEIWREYVRMNLDPAAAMAGEIRLIDPDQPIDSEAVERFQNKFRDDKYIGQEVRRFEQVINIFYMDNRGADMSRNKAEVKHSQAVSIIQDVGSTGNVNIHVEKFKSEGAEDLAQTISSLMEALTKSLLPEKQKAHYLQYLDLLSCEALKPKDQRNGSLLGFIFDHLDKIPAATTGVVAELVNKCRDFLNLSRTGS